MNYLDTRIDTTNNKAYYIDSWQYWRIYNAICVYHLSTIIRLTNVIAHREFYTLRYEWIEW